jgi:hypothetical protein
MRVLWTARATTPKRLNFSTVMVNPQPSNYTKIVPNEPIFVIPQTSNYARTLVLEPSIHQNKHRNYFGGKLNTMQYGLKWRGYLRLEEMGPWRGGVWLAARDGGRRGGVQWRRDLMLGRRRRAARGARGLRRSGGGPGLVGGRTKVFGATAPGEEARFWCDHAWLAWPRVVGGEESETQTESVWPMALRWLKPVLVREY